MRTIILFLLLLVSLQQKAQTNTMFTIDDYVGTWKYENKDTVFTIILKEGITKNVNYTPLYPRWIIFGGYSLSINGCILDDYTQISSTFDRNIGNNESQQKIYISGSIVKEYSNHCGFTFYDQRKKHFNGEGILGGKMTMIDAKTLKWEIDEEFGIWHKIEGCEDCPEVKPIGFSVPNGIIMTKVQ